MTDFVTVNNARLGYRLCGPDDAPLIIALHGGRGMGTGNVPEPVVSVEKANSAQVITDQTSKHLVLWMTSGACSHLTTGDMGRVLAPNLIHSSNLWTTSKASDSILLGKERKSSSAVVALVVSWRSSMQSSMRRWYLI